MSLADHAPAAVPGAARLNRSMPAATVIPVLGYADLPAAVDWLCRAFGLRERLRIGDHRVQLQAGDGAVVALQLPAGAPPPSGLSVMLRVTDADAHCAQALRCGATLQSPPTSYPYGERQYSVHDPGGHAWTFSQTEADVDPASWGGELMAGAAAAELDPDASPACYCGRVRVRLAMPAKSLVHCHCGQCRRLSGAAFTSWVSVARGAFVLHGAEHLQVFAPTANLKRHFCAVCGSHVYTEDGRQPQIVGLPVGALEGQPLPSPRAHYFVDDRVPWWPTLDDGLPCFGGEHGNVPRPAPGAR